MSSRSGPVSFGDREAHQGHDAIPAPSDTPGEYLNHPTFEVAGCTNRDDYGNSSDSNTANENGGGSEYDGVLWMVVHPCGKTHHFCRVGQCLYWHTDSKQIWRHRNAHFRGRYGWLCPNRTDTCPNFKSDFARRDEVWEHCKKFSKCGDALRVNSGKIKCWGNPANNGDLVDYNPEYHISYWGSCGKI